MFCLFYMQCYGRVIVIYNTLLTTTYVFKNLHQLVIFFCYTYSGGLCKISRLHFKRRYVIQFNITVINDLNFRLVRIFVLVQKIVSCFTALKPVLML